MAERIYLLRHAQAYSHVDDGELTRQGKKDAEQLAIRLKEDLGETPVEIWSSPALRAVETTRIIVKAKVQGPAVRYEEKLWCDNRRKHDFKWLQDMIVASDAKDIVIVTHKEYVNKFPASIGYEVNEIEYAQGVLISGGICTLFG
jgi:phosphohistidine phosphatase SixA